nr:immunoglobulin heavy chain junction region [Mus musculus]
CARRRAYGGFFDVW